MKGYVPTPILPERYLINKQGQIYSLRSNKHIATRLDRYGYVRVNLYEGTKNHTVTVHRLLALALHTEENVIDVCERLNRGQANAKIRRETGYTISFIEKIKYGETWTHITEQYGIIPKSERATTIQR